MLQLLRSLGPAEQDKLERILAERSLVDFVTFGWNAVEPGAFQPNWHVEAICDHLEAISRREIKRLIINLPPRHMKSLAANVFWPAWNWAQDTGIDFRTGQPRALRPNSWLGPGCKFTYLSYAQDLSTRDSVQCRRLLDSNWYQKHWNDRFGFADDQNTKTKYINNRGGHRLSLSFQGKITGEGADIMIIDDPHNVRDVESRVQREDTLKVWDESLPTRLNNPKWSAFVVIMQRTHERDLCGHILAKETGWTHLCLPAVFEPDHPFIMKTTVRRQDGRVWVDPRNPGELLWPTRFDDELIAEWKGRMGSYASAGQLQQRPAPREGGLFKLHWFADNYVDAVPADAERVRAWDLASTEGGATFDPDWTVGVKMAKTRDGVFYVEDVKRFRGSPLEVKSMIRAVAEQDEQMHRRVHIRLPQDPGQAGKAQANDLVRHLSGFVVHARAMSGDKETRAKPLAAQAEAKNVKLLRAPWNLEFIEELCMFPNGRHDDQVDATADAFIELTQMKKAARIYSGGI
jgi:predicted phage terminase large subunit-like protein